MKCDCENRHVYRTPVREMISRRGFVGDMSLGLGGIALGALLGESLSASPNATYDVLPKVPHFAPRAKRVILLFQNGGPSQMDLFDPKPELNKRDGEKPGEGYVNGVDAKKTGSWMGSPFKFSRHGRSGLELSELLPGLARHADDIAVIRSMVTEHQNHEQAIWNFNTGLIQPGRPSLGSWVTYALGTENQSLPSFVAILNPKGLPVDGARNYSSGWMPPVYQGMPVRAEGTPVINLESQGSREAAAGRLELVQQLNRKHLRTRQDQLELEARIASFELAAKMQIEASPIFDLSQESPDTHEMYGTGREETAIHARQCLLARRLVEHGVRFVQVLHKGQPWDTHRDNNGGTKRVAEATDQPTAALLTDLKRLGLLEDTLVIWAGEFGRTPMAEATKDRVDGRDHHKHAFSLWIAGGGIQGGVTHGATDDFAYHAVENIVTVPDFHATMLHLLGLDYNRLTFRHGTLDEKLTDVKSAKVVKAVLA